MRLVVFSDSHRHPAALECICNAQRQADLFIHLGDGEGDVAWLRVHLPDLPLKWVRGNCDWAQEGPAELLLDLYGIRVLAIHGHNLSVKHGTTELEKYARRMDAQVALFGHTHIPLCEYRDGLWLVNPGNTVCKDRLRFALVDLMPSGIACSLAEIAR